MFVTCFQSIQDFRIGKSNMQNVAKLKIVLLFKQEKIVAHFIHYLNDFRLLP